MNRKEKVLKGLQACHREPETPPECQNYECPYEDAEGFCLRTMIADALEELSGTCWIRAADRLPENHRTVLAVKQLKSGQRDICLAYCIPEYERTNPVTKEVTKSPYWVCGGNNNIVYWMPLPELPAKE